jgi:hypothetical protein
VQTLAEYKVESQGKITVIINGEHGISDLWIIWVFLAFLGVAVAVFGTISFSLKKRKKQ